MAQPRWIIKNSEFYQSGIYKGSCPLSYSIGKMTAKQDHERENRAYDMHISYTSKSKEKQFLDYFGPKTLMLCPMYYKNISSIM